MQITTSRMEHGLRQGLGKGESQRLRSQLQRRFGMVPDIVEQRLDPASIEELECWVERILDAKTLDEIFDEE